MNSRLATALNLLGIHHHSHASAKEHAQALFTYLHIAGYLSKNNIEKAVTYLSVAKPFMEDNETVKNDLMQAYTASIQNDHNLNFDNFFEQFAGQDYFSTSDIVDLLTFLQQTAFDRQFGVERDQLAKSSWMTDQIDLFITLAKQLGVTAESAPRNLNYCGVGVMGASDPRVVIRLNYLKKITSQLNEKNLGSVYALTGQRELSKGLDTEPVMEAVARHLGKEANYVEKSVGTTTRIFLDGVTETDMVNYLIATQFPELTLEVVDSQIQEGHTRATTAQSATDIAKLVLNKIQENGVTQDEYHFMIIAEQPFTQRMTRQVQRAFNAAIAERDLAINIIVEGCGPELVEADIRKYTAVVNSDLGALMGERFNDARIELSKTEEHLRPKEIIMFAQREAKYREYQAALEQSRTLTPSYS